MAVMIPESCPDRATSGEKWLFNFFRDWLTDDFTVWYEPVIQGRYPDFTIISASTGLIVLEVRAWSLSQIRWAGETEVEVLVSEGGTTDTEKIQNPFAKVREFTLQLVDRLKKQPLLCEPSGDRQGELCFSYSCGVVFVNITKDQLEKFEHARFFPLDRAICKSELAELAKAKDERGIIKRLAHVWGTQVRRAATVGSD